MYLGILFCCSHELKEALLYTSKESGWRAVWSVISP